MSTHTSKTVTVGGTVPRQVDLLPFGKPTKWARVLPPGSVFPPGRYHAEIDPETLTCKMTPEDADA